MTEVRLGKLKMPRNILQKIGEWIKGNEARQMYHAINITIILYTLKTLEVV